jgi:5-deoxy-D-glucuronate isomerase
MNSLKTTLKISAAAVTIALAGGSFAATMSKDDYKAAKEKAEATYSADKTQCSNLAGNAKDICMAEAKGKKNVAEAQAEFSLSGKASDMEKLNKAKAEAQYDVANERCDDKAGNDKDVCVKQAKAQRVSMMSDVKASKEIAEARMDSANDKRDAQYKVEAEKCDAMAGDAKTACMNQAKASYGK